MFAKLFESEKNFNILIATCVLLILAIPVGIANVLLGYVIGENPCTLCWFERSGMMLIGVMGIFMLRYGMRLKYLAMTIFSTWFGLYMTIRHTGNLHALDQAQGFGDAIMGMHTYTWGVFVYWVAVFAVLALLLFVRHANPVSKDLSGERAVVKPLSGYSTAVVVLSALVLLSNAFQAFCENGVPPFSGKGRPARFTLDLSKASVDWTTHVWDRLSAPWSMRGPEGIEWPFVAGVNEGVSVKFNADPKAGPMKLSEGSVKILAEHNLPFKAEGCLGAGKVTGISWNAKQNKFGFVTNNAGLYYTDASFAKMTDRAILDKPNGNDIRITVDTVFMGNTMVSIAFNKTIYASQLVDPKKVDAWWQWRIFREATPAFAPVWKFNRPWLTTSRARLGLVASGAYDSATNSLHLVTVPNNRIKKSMLATFDMADRQVTAEHDIKAADASMVKQGRKLDYYVTGSVMAGGKLLAFSKNYNSLLVINPASARIEKVLAMPAMKNPHSMAVANGKLYMLGLDGERNFVYEMTMPAI